MYLYSSFRKDGMRCVSRVCKHSSCSSLSLHPMLQSTAVRADWHENAFNENSAHLGCTCSLCNALRVLSIHLSSACSVIASATALALFSCR